MVFPGGRIAGDLSVGECEEILGRTIEIDGNSILDGNIYKGGGYVGSDKISSGAGSLNTASQVGDNQYSNAGTLGTDPTLRYSFVFWIINSKFF